ncbi:hypothetical protein SEA_BUNKER_53 [Gordonia phage Bunker]|nr:hypothetical protein SEA_BUNKER_53 [Gordonia phage Bunker]
MTTEQVRVTLRTRPRRAVQWDGRYHSGEQIARMLNGRLIVWPVPRGYDHPLRKDSEKDSSRGDVLEYAEEFLVIYGSAADKKPLRVPARWWFVWDDDVVEMLSPDDFDREYSVDGAEATS